MLALPRVLPSVLIARSFSRLAFARTSGAPCMRQSRMVAWPSTLSPSAVARHRSCCAFMQVPNLSASLKVLVECASRKRAAPRSQFNGVACGDVRAGQGPWRGQQVQGLRRWRQPRCVALFWVAYGSEITTPGFAVKQRPNPSVELRANGRPLQGKRVLSLRGRPLSPAHLKR